METAYDAAKGRIAEAQRRVEWLLQRSNCHPGTDPYTDVDRVVDALHNLAGSIEERKAIGPPRVLRLPYLRS